MLKPKHYDDALVVQDACNLLGVLTSFISLLRLAHSDLRCKEEVRHPAVILYASKVVALAGWQSRFAELQDRRGASNAIMDLRVTLEAWRASLKAYKNVHEELGTFNTDEANKAFFAEGFARSVVELTMCEDINLFSLAYEACQEASRLEGDVSEDEEWLWRQEEPRAG